MKKYFLSSMICLLVIGTSVSCAQKDDKSKRKSPPAEVSGKVGDAQITINYSQPSVNGRTIWGELVPYDKVWRTGANEATTFETTKDIKVEGQLLKAGKYSLFTIPGEKEWVVIFNSVPEQWGAYKYDDSKDVLRVKVKPTQSSNQIEQMVFSIVNKGDAVNVALGWDKLVLPITVSQ